jgi:predicted GIY-YIG superfamily endonuclease
MTGVGMEISAGSVSDLGTVYLLHFDQRFKHAGHYLGWTRDLPRRIERHFKGHGSRLVQVVVDAGIGISVVRTWSGGRDLERRLKKRGGRSRLCPFCLKERASCRGG